MSDAPQPGSDGEDALWPCWYAPRAGINGTNPARTSLLSPRQTALGEHRTELVLRC